MPSHLERLVHRQPLPRTRRRRRPICQDRITRAYPALPASTAGVDPRDVAEAEGAIREHRHQRTGRPPTRDRVAILGAAGAVSDAVALEHGWGAASRSVRLSADEARIGRSGETRA